MLLNRPVLMKDGMHHRGDFKLSLRLKGNYACITGGILAYFIL